MLSLISRPTKRICESAAIHGCVAGQGAVSDVSIAPYWF